MNYTLHNHLTKQQLLHIIELLNQVDFVNIINAIRKQFQKFIYSPFH